MSSTTPAAADTLNVCDAMQDPTRRTYSRGEVAYLLHLAYLAGQTAAVDEQVARIVCNWDDRAHLRATYEQRVAAELADMDAAARARAAREGRPYRVHPGGPVDWETGRPARRLGVAA